jgi:hypothetical protein
MASKTVHFRLPVSSRDGFKVRTACGAKSDSYSTAPEEVSCRRCRGSEALVGRKAALAALEDERAAVVQRREAQARKLAAREEEAKKKAPTKKKAPAKKRATTRKKAAPKK